MIAVFSINRLEEVRALFPKGYRTVWEDKEIAHAANLLALITGMRIGEVIRLRGSHMTIILLYADNTALTVIRIALKQKK